MEITAKMQKARNILLILGILLANYTFAQEAIYKCRAANGKTEINNTPCPTSTKTERVIEKEYIPEERLEQAQQRRREMMLLKQKELEIQLYQALEKQKQQKEFAEQQARDARMRQMIREEAEKQNRQLDFYSPPPSPTRQTPQPGQEGSGIQFCKPLQNGKTMFCY